jgi:hypothetical protein
MEAYVLPIVLTAYTTGIIVYTNKKYKKSSGNK